jgi:ADP-ribosylglycohydrolase
VIALPDRLAGGVWGHLIGDAMGVPYEFTPAEAIERVEWGHRGTHGQPPGTWSDDGALMLALLDSLLSNGFDVEDQARCALMWLDENAYAPGPLFDIGNTTHAALQRLKSGVPAAEAGGAGEADNGNGSLMRILPVALVDRNGSLETVVDHAIRASALTHRHPRSQLVCAVYCLVARSLLHGEPREHAASRACEAVRDLVSESHVGELPTVERFTTPTGSGYVVDTFWSAWSVFASSGSFAETIERAIRFGSDTDTTAAVAGGLAGIYWGRSGIPAEWLSALRGREIVEPLVARLSAP